MVALEKQLSKEIDAADPERHAVLSREGLLDEDHNCPVLNDVGAAMKNDPVDVKKLLG